MNNEKTLNLIDKIDQYYSSLRYLSGDELRTIIKEIENDILQSKDQVTTMDFHLSRVYAIIKETARRFNEGNIIVTANDNDKKISEKYDFVTIKGENAIYHNYWHVGMEEFHWKMVHYDEQLMAGIYLHHKYAVEMGTGEGKTLTATLPVFLNALTHKGIHIMTTNEYLSKRDCEITRPIYMFYGLSVDCIEYYTTLTKQRKQAYKADVVFGVNSTFVFDYLYDHLVMNPESCVQQEHNFAIIDELDSNLIDNSNISHIISGENRYNRGDVFKKYQMIVEEFLALNDNSLYIIDKINKNVNLTDKGKEWLSEKTGMKNLFQYTRPYQFDGYKNMKGEQKKEVLNKLFIQNAINQLIRAYLVFEKDVDYIVEESGITIIDENTGRKKRTSIWINHLHTAVEVKEDIIVESDSDSIASISLKNYFKLYNKISGMSGTITDVSKELEDVFSLKTKIIPPHQPVIRNDYPIKIYKTKEAKEKAIIQTIIDIHKKGRPILTASTSIKNCEKICSLMDKTFIPYQKLNAKSDIYEAEIISKAGKENTVTIATSMQVEEQILNFLIMH